MNKNIKLKDSEFVIEKGEKLDIILKRNIPNLSSLNIFYIKIYYQMNKLFFNKFIHFGNFYIEKIPHLLIFLILLTNLAILKIN